MKKHFLGLALFICAGIAEAGTLDDLVRQVQDAQRRDQQVDAERGARFLADKSQQQKLLRDTQAALAKAEAESKALRDEFTANEAELAKLSTDLKNQSGELGDLFGMVREFAGALKSDLDTSLVSAQFQGRGDKLEPLIASKELPNIPQLESLWLAVLKEMTESGKTVKYHGRVTTSAGAAHDAEIYRIGAFSAFADGKYLRFTPETGQLVELPRQPERQFTSLANKLSDTPDDLVEIAVDPTRGTVLELSMRTPDFWERISYGGAIGYIIIALGIVGAVIVVARLISLHRTGKKMQAQLADLNAYRDDNPLGRILAASGNFTNGNIEKLELQLDEAVLCELPALERGLPIVKLLIAIAPLLGLLGTVTGMIQVFQSITQHGSGDPRLMAGGIAEALVTTMLGLQVAIPLSFLYSLLSTRSRALVQILDEQSAGILSQRIEHDR